MRKFRLKRSAQTTLEYAILIGVIAAALITMQIYLKRGYQGKIKSGADSMGEQFSPGLSTSNYTTNSLSNTQEVIGNGTTTTTIHNQWSDRSGDASVNALVDEDLFY
jgi:Flp pilus assembly pilin Flp